MAASSRVRSLTQSSAAPGEMPNAGSPTRAWVMVIIRKASVIAPPGPSASSAGISRAMAWTGETPVSGIEAWAVRPVRVTRSPWLAHIIVPGLMVTWPSRSPGMLCKA